MAGFVSAESLRAVRDDDEVDVKQGQIESPVQAVRKGAKVALGIFDIFEGFVGARQHGLAVVQDGVDLIKLRLEAGLVLTDHFSPVGATCVQDVGETGQTVADG
jgi:hypothetical protein